jgi:hypothetical protein
MALTVTIMMEHRDVSNKLNVAKFNTHSTTIGIDNRCTACISNNTDHFVGELKPAKHVIKGFGGVVNTKVMIGTIRWIFFYHNGLEHTFNIPNSFYIPGGNVCLLSPQHWAQSMKDGKAWEVTGTKDCNLHWQNGKHTLVVPLGQPDNFAMLHLSPGYQKFKAFCTLAELKHDHEHDQNPIIASEATAISNNEDDDNNDFSDNIQEVIKMPVPERENRKRKVRTEEEQDKYHGTYEDGRTNTTDFNLNGPTEDEHENEVNLVEEDV